jgi:hypothetical protein
MQIPINVGYSIENTSSDLEDLKVLERKGVVTLIENEYVRCKNCHKGLIDIKSFEGNSMVSCPNCDRQCGLSTSRMKRTAIAEINYKKIISTFDKLLQNTFGESNIHFDKFERNWIIELDGKKYLFYIYGISTVASFLSISENEGVILYLDERTIRSQIHDLNQSRYRYVFDPIFTSPEKFKAFIDSLAFTESLEYLKFREKFEAFLSSKTNTQYETEFIPQFIEGIKLKNRELSKLYSRLQLVENTILNSKYLKKGGSGVEDFHLVNLNKYLQDGLRSDRSGEAKKFRKTQFDFDDLMRAIGHADHFKETLFFVSTNDIAPSVWQKIMDERTIDGHFKYVIIDKDLMLMLLYNLNLIHMIDTPSIEK